MAHWEKVCAYCAYMNTDLSLVRDGRFQCDCDHEWRFADTLGCDRFCEIFWYKASMSGEAIRESRNYKSSLGCHITTAIVKILGLPENCRELTVLKDFRAKVMEPNPKYGLMLLKYDVYGPKVAEFLHSKHDVDFAADLYNTYIKKTVELIEEGNRFDTPGASDNEYYDAALELYTDMTRMLIQTCIPGYTSIQNGEKSEEQAIGGRGSFTMEKKEA